MKFPGIFLCTKFPVLYSSFLCTKPPIHLLCIAPPILHEMVPTGYVYGVSYIQLWLHLMYTDHGVLLLYIRLSLYVYVLLWVHLMYTDYRGVLLPSIRWSLYICSAVCTIMGPSHVHWLSWGLTPVHKMASYICSVTPVLLCIHLMFSNIIAKKTMQILLKDVDQFCKSHYHQKASWMHTICCSTASYAVAKYTCISWNRKMICTWVYRCTGLVVCYQKLVANRYSLLTVYLP